jgi:hypothetical protein
LAEYPPDLLVDRIEQLGDWVSELNPSLPKYTTRIVLPPVEPIVLRSLHRFESFPGHRSGSSHAGETPRTPRSPIDQRPVLGAPVRTPKAAHSTAAEMKQRTLFPSAATKNNTGVLPTCALTGLRLRSAANGYATATPSNSIPTTTSRSSIGPGAIQAESEFSQSVFPTPI